MEISKADKSKIARAIIGCLNVLIEEVGAVVFEEVLAKQPSRHLLIPTMAVMSGGKFITGSEKALFNLMMGLIIEAAVVKGITRDYITNLIHNPDEVNDPFQQMVFALDVIMGERDFSGQDFMDVLGALTILAEEKYDA